MTLRAAASYRFARCSQLGGGKSSGLRAMLDGPDLFLPVGGFAEHYRAGDVGLVAVYGTAIVQQNHVSPS